MTARVATAVGHRWEADLVARMASVSAVRVARRCADLPDLLATGSAGQADVALVSADLAGLDRDALSHLHVHRVRVVGLAPPGDEAAERRLRQLGVAVVLAADAGAEELARALGGSGGAGAGTPGDVPTLEALGAGDALEAPGSLDPVDGTGSASSSAAATDEPAPSAGRDDGAGPAAGEEDRPGRVVAVWGPTGAPGRTTLAVNLAAELAAGGVPTLLVDADTYGASVAQWLAVLDEAPGVAAAARASEQGSLDLDRLAGLAPEALPGLRVLTGLPTPQRWTELRPAALEQVLTLARRLARVVVVDCGFGIEDDEELSYDTLAPRRNAATLTTLGLADDLVLVGAADPVGLQRLVRAVQDLGSVPSPRPRVVVNRVRASAVGPGPQRRISGLLERFAGLEDLLFVPFDPETVDGALLAGRTLGEHAPTAPARLAVRAVAAPHLPERRRDVAAARTGRAGRRRRFRRSATMSPWQSA